MVGAQQALADAYAALAAGTDLATVAAMHRPAVIVPPVIWLEPPTVDASNGVLWTVTLTLIGVTAGDDQTQLDWLYEWADVVPAALLAAGYSGIAGGPYDPGDLNGVPSTALAYAWSCTATVPPWAPPAPPEPPDEPPPEPGG